MMKKLFEPFSIRHTQIKNRVVLPPMVVYMLDEYANEHRIAHYGRIAQGGAGLVIVEAACVQDGGQLGKNQLGIWDDRHIESLTPLAQAIHEGGAKALIQIHHAGVVGVNGHDCPDAYVLSETVTGRKMSLADIEEVSRCFIEAGVRAHRAGFDGVEVHGCHSYLLCQFFNRRVNRRDDVYGQQPEKLAADILNGIRERTDDDFIIGIRMGGFEPALEDGIAHAKLLEAAGYDFLDVSYGFGKEMDVSAPEGYPFVDVIHAAAEIKKQIACPVFAVNSIRTGEMAQRVLEETNVDAVDIGRAMLVDAEWANKVQRGEEPDRCFGCARCRRMPAFSPDGSDCPALKKYGKVQTI